MCRHCERLIEDKAEADLVHAFMASLAAKVNRKISEDLAAAAARGKRIDPSRGGELLYNAGMSLQRPVTADDISLDVHVNATFWHDNPFNGTKAQSEVYRMLQEAFN